MNAVNGVQEGFRQWCVVELMGHLTIAGEVSEATIGGAALLRVDVPEVEGVPGYTRYVAPASLYSLTPVEEGVARKVAAYHRVRPVQPYVIAERPSLLIERDLDSSCELPEDDEDPF